MLSKWKPDATADPSIPRAAPLVTLDDMLFEGTASRDLRDTTFRVQGFTADFIVQHSVGLVREWALWEAQDAAARTADQELLDGRWPHWPHDESMWENSVHFVSSTGSALPAGCHFPQLHFCNDDVDCNGAMAELQ